MSALHGRCVVQRKDLTYHKIPLIETGMTCSVSARTLCVVAFVSVHTIRHARRRKKEEGLTAVLPHERIDGSVSVDERIMEPTQAKLP